MTIFRDALASDDEQLTELIATPMPGALSLSFSRDPSYLQACQSCGPKRSVLTAVDGREIVATCSYFKRDYWFQGVRRGLWMVCDMRARDRAAGLSVTGRGWPELRERLGPEPRFMSLVSDNVRADRLFRKSRPGWPRLVDWLALRTHIFPLAGVRAKRAGAAIRPLGQEELLSFLDELGPNRDLVPVVESHDFGSVLPGGQDFWGYFEAGKMVACAGLWNPAERQVRVHSYGGWYETVYRTGRRFGLPSPGRALNISYVVLLLGAEKACARLLAHLRSQAKARGASFLVWGSAEGAPALPKVHWPKFTYHSTLSQLLWDEEQPLPKPRPGATYEVAWL